MKINYNLIVFISLLLSGTIKAQIDNRNVEAILRVETMITDFLNQANLPGLSIAVSQNDHIVYANGFGYADVKKKVKMKHSTLLRADSVSKVITATALGRLASTKRLHFDMPIGNYIPYLKKPYAQLTVRQLAAHTSGLPHRPRNHRKYSKKQFTSIKESVALINAPLEFSPNTNYKYSTLAYTLLAAVIEGASGMSYMEYMQQGIFIPLDMMKTKAENIEMLTEADASLYYLKKGKLKNEKLTNGSYKLPGAGFRTTPTDLLVMMKAYSNGFIVPEVVEDMFGSHQLNNGQKVNVGITWRSSIDAFGSAVIEHAGSWRGARTVIVHYPKENISIALMINSTCQVLIEETAHIIAQFFKRKKNTKPAIQNINKKITLDFNDNGKQISYTGVFTFADYKGMLNTDSKGFFNANPLHFINDNHYALITPIGLLYVNLNLDNGLKGKVFLYQTRNKINPVENKAMAIFKD